MPIAMADKTTDIGVEIHQEHKLRLKNEIRSEVPTPVTDHLRCSDRRHTVAFFRTSEVTHVLARSTTLSPHPLGES